MKWGATPRAKSARVTTVTPTFVGPFVRGDAGALRAVIVAAPNADIATISPTHGESNAIAERATAQFIVFTSRLAAHGIKLVPLEATAAVPLAVLCADCAVVFEDGAFLMRPSDQRRRGEIALVEAALARAQIPVIGRIEAPGLLDGGDVLRVGDTLYLGVDTKRQAEVGLPRFTHGNVLGREQLAAYARSKQLKVVEVAMASEVRHLRSVASLVGTQTVLYASGLIDGTAFADLEKIEAPRGEDYGAGVLTLGDKRVLANLRFRETIPLLRKAKVSVDAIDLWEFGKIGATPSSMALALKRD